MIYYYPIRICNSKYTDFLCFQRLWSLLVIIIKTHRDTKILEIYPQRQLIIKYFTFHCIQTTNTAFFTFNKYNHQTRQKKPSMKIINPEEKAMAKATNIKQNETSTSNLRHAKPSQSSRATHLNWMDSYSIAPTTNKQTAT